MTLKCQAYFKPGQYHSDRDPNRAPKGPILLGASPPDPPASAFGLQKVGLRPPWVPVRAGWAQKVGLRPPWVPIRAGWAQNGTPYGFPKNWKSKMDPKWIQNGPFGLKLCPNESESTPGPFTNPPGPTRSFGKPQRVVNLRYGFCKKHVNKMCSRFEHPTSRAL